MVKINEYMDSKVIDYLGHTFKGKVRDLSIPVHFSNQHHLRFCAVHGVARHSPKVNDQTVY